MSLAADLAGQPRRRGSRCSVCVFLEVLPADAAAEVVEALADDRVTAAALDRWARTEHPDIHPATQTWARHRNGRCSG